MKKQIAYTKDDINNLKALIEHFKTLLINYLNFYKEINKKPTKLISEYGELLAQYKLLEENFHISVLGGQSKADLVIIYEENNKKDYIEVKTSTLKEEENGIGWGAALNKKDCNKHNEKDFCYFDYLIFITLNEGFIPNFYIFTNKEIISHESDLLNKSKHYKKSTNRIWIPIKPNPNNNFSRFELSLYKNQDFLERWDKIKSKNKI